MRKRTTLRTFVLALTVSLLAALLGAQAARGIEPSLPAVNELSTEMMDRARGDVTRVQALIGEGSLPQSSLKEAEARLADVTDQATLIETLYSSVTLADSTADQLTRMLAAAQRRVYRQTAIVAERQNLLAMGIISKSETNSVNTELETRQQVLDLVHGRLRLVETERQMAEQERNLARALESPGAQKAMLKFAGSGHFGLRDLSIVASAFERQFHCPLPITARG